MSHHVDHQGVAEDPAARNADQLEQALAQARQELGSVVDDEQRQRRANAIALMSRYAARLRDSTTTSGPPSLGCYQFKLEYPDGSWSVDEKQLPAPPCEGDPEPTAEAETG